MKKNSHYEIRFFEGYLRGNLSKEEEIALYDWINQSDNNYQIFKKYITENQFSQSYSEEIVQAWENLKSKITYHRTLRENRRIIIPTWLKIAAAVVIALLSGFYANQFINENRYSDVLNEIIIPNGEKAQVILSDGTKVDLNAGTYFKYPAVFSKKNRKVTIAGEAFFNVAKDKRHPFIIETPKFNVNVTGTSFNLNTYKEDEVNSLTLHTGEITISNKGQEFKIHPGERYTLNTKTNKFAIVEVDLQKSHLWTEGVIVIDNMNLDEVRKILERKFDVQIKIVEEKYKKIRYNGQFKPHETLEDVLNMIKETSPVKFKYEINMMKKEVIIK